MIQIIKSQSRNRDFIVYDMEWVPGTLQIRLVGVYDGNNYRCYKSVEDFLSCELTNKNRGKWFYAHAGGLADVQFVLNTIAEYNKHHGDVFQVEACFSGSSAIIVSVTKHRNKWTFVDSYWLLRDKLKNIGKWIGKSKGNAVEDEADDPDEPGLDDKEFERRMQKRREWYATVDLYKLIDYNKMDCEILFEAISNFQNALLDMGGQLQMTLASCAMQLFKRKYLTRNIETYNEINAKARLSYFASRVEVFEKNVTNAFYYDINSSFPFAMTQPCPGEFAGRTYRLPDNDKYIYTADCEIESPEGYITPMPIRMNGRVFFPHGKWRAWITSIDLDLLIREGGRITKVHEVLLFHPFHDLAGYSADLYKRRKDSTNDFEKIVYKLLLNSLYGKFAESEFKSKLVLNPSITPITYEEQHALKMVQLFPGAWLQEVEVPVPHMCVPISAHITAFARRTLFDLLSICRDFHYCDTDGFSTTENLTTGKELGELKLEKIIRNGHFVASKMYHLEGQVLNDKNQWEDSVYNKGKGFSRLSTSRLFKLIEGDSIQFERMARIKEIWRKGGKEGTFPRENTYTKRIKVKSMFAEDFDYKKDSIPKRFTYPDGSTRPWHLEELKDMF